LSTYKHYKKKSFHLKFNTHVTEIFFVISSTKKKIDFVFSQKTLWSHWVNFTPRLGEGLLSMNARCTLMTPKPRQRHRSIGATD